MAWQFPLSTSTVAANAVDLGATDSVFVGHSVQIASSTGHAILGAGNGHVVDIHGTVVNYSQWTIALWGDLVSTVASTVRIAETGFVKNFREDSNGAISVYGGNALIENAGHVEGTWAIMVTATAAANESRIVNTGQITGHYAGVWVSVAGENVLVNSGRIVGDDYAYSSEADAIDLITNTGRMIGDISLGNGADRYDGRGGRVQGDVRGGNGQDTLIGGSFADIFRGDAQADKLTGNGGADRLFGGGGNDRLDGGIGNDRLTGNGGADTFVFKNNYDRDSVLGFQKGNDRIELKDNLWAGNRTAEQVVDQFATINGARTQIIFDFGGGDVLTVNGNNLRLNQIDNDLVIV